MGNVFNASKRVINLIKCKRYVILGFYIQLFKYVLELLDSPSADGSEIASEIAVNFFEITSYNMGNQPSVLQPYSFYNEM